MSKYGIVVDITKCVGCHACAIACKEENQVDPGIFYERVHRFENPSANVINYFRVSCMHCDDPACMKVCPAKAISKGPAGEVLVDHTKCIGCQMCLSACPYGAPQFNTEGKTSYFGDKVPLVDRLRDPWQVHASTVRSARTGRARGSFPRASRAAGSGRLSSSITTIPPRRRNP